MDRVTVVSLALGAAGVIVGILGWLASLRGLKEAAKAKERERTAQQAAKAARQELLQQRAAEDFRAIAEKVELLFPAINSKKWRAAWDLLMPIKKQLSEANGSFQDILKFIDMDEMDVAITAVKRLVAAVQHLETDAAAMDPEAVPALIEQCDRIAGLVNQIYGRLKYLRVEEIQ